MKAADAAWFRALGRHYGYPECCIRAFIRRMEAIDAGHDPGPPRVAVQGFVPCPAHAELILAGSSRRAVTIEDSARATARGALPCWEHRPGGSGIYEERVMSADVRLVGGA